MAHPLGLRFDPQPVRQPAVGGIVMQKPAHARALPQAGAASNLTAGKADWTALGNQVAGDCVLAAIGHAMQAAGWYAMQQTIRISEDETLAAYTAITGWQPGNPDDEGPGMTVQAGLDYVHEHHLGGHRIAYWHRSNWLPGEGGWWRDRDCLSRDHLKSMLSWFGGLMLSIDLPKTAWQNDVGPWRASDMEAASAGGHCIPIIGYDDNWFYCITWGNTVQLDWEFVKRYTRETFFICPEQWMRWDATWPANPARTPDFGMTSEEIPDTFTAYCGMELFAVVPWP